MIDESCAGWEVHFLSALDLDWCMSCRGGEWRWSGRRCSGGAITGLVDAVTLSGELRRQI